MHRLVIAASATVVLGVLLPAGAVAAPADPHVRDACGDADVMARVGDTVVPTQDAERAAGFDIAAVWFKDLYNDEEEHVGVRVHLEMCGALPDTDLLPTNWAVGWNLSGPCNRVVSVGDRDDLTDPSSGLERVGFLESHCTRPGTIPGTFEGYVDWTEPLEDLDFRVEGRVVSWTLTPTMLPAARADRLAFLEPGTTWSSTGASARDGRQVTVAAADQPVPFHLSGPGAWDFAGGGRSFTVGEDRP